MKRWQTWIKMRVFSCHIVQWEKQFSQFGSRLCHLSLNPLASHALPSSYVGRSLKWLPPTRASVGRMDWQMDADLRWFRGQPKAGERRSSYKLTSVCLFVCVCVCNLAVICLIIPFRSMDFDGENMAFYFWAYLNYTLVTLVITELFTKFLCFGLRGRYLKNWWRPNRSDFSMLSC